MLESLPVPPPAPKSTARSVEASERLRSVGRLEVRDTTRGERTVVTSLQRVYSAGQQLLADRAELLLREAQLRVSTATRGILLAGLGGILAAVGWVGLMSAVVLWLEPSIELAESIAIVAGANFAIATLLVWLGTRSLGAGE